MTRQEMKEMLSELLAEKLEVRLERTYGGLYASSRVTVELRFDGEVISRDDVSINT